MPPSFFEILNEAVSEGTSRLARLSSPAFTESTRVKVTRIFCRCHKRASGSPRGERESIGHLGHERCTDDSSRSWTLENFSRPVTDVGSFLVKVAHLCHLLRSLPYKLRTCKTFAKISSARSGAVTLLSHAGNQIQEKRTTRTRKRLE